MLWRWRDPAAFPVISPGLEHLICWSQCVISKPGRQSDVRRLRLAVTPRLRAFAREVGAAVAGLLRCSCSHLASVHRHVDDLCATAPSLCIRGGNAGDSAAWL